PLPYLSAAEGGAVYPVHARPSSWMGWLTGLEPATPGVTVQCSTIELQPPYGSPPSDAAAGSTRFPRTAPSPLGSERGGATISTSGTPDIAPIAQLDRAPAF